MDLIGTASSAKQVIWSLSEDKKSFITSPISNIFKNDLCEFADPHTNAFIDLDGDCLADFVVRCKNPADTVQIWRNTKDQGFVLHLTLELPSGAGPISFADIGMSLLFNRIDSDGAMDMIFPVCASECSIHVLYNIQKPYCDTITDKDCKSMTSLCQGDASFTFKVNEKSAHVIQSLPSIGIQGSIVTEDSVLKSPLPIRIGTNITSFIHL
jgi:integrin alpha FG-GAP repeat containing protein 1